MSEVDGQLSMFSMIPEGDWHTQALREKLKGGKCGWSSSRIRIWTAAERLDRDRLADYIQNEYGISGGSVKGGTVMFNNRGAWVYNFQTKVEKHFAWHKVRNMILDMINNGEYLTDGDREQIEKIKEEHNGLMPLTPPDGSGEGEEE